MPRLILIAAIVCAATIAQAQGGQPAQPLAPSTTLPPLQPLILDQNVLRMVCLMPGQNGQGTVIAGHGWEACTMNRKVRCVDGKWDSNGSSC